MVAGLTRIAGQNPMSGSRPHGAPWLSVAAFGPPSSGNRASTNTVETHCSRLEESRSIFQDFLESPASTPRTRKSSTSSWPSAQPGPDTATTSRIRSLYATIHPQAMCPHKALTATHNARLR